jgi:pimeloyl-ACP methyl ester carboxylesterase
MSDDLFELAGNLKLNKFFLAGHSMGGKTAISFALKWPGMINGLLIADISPFKDANIRHSSHIQHLNILNAMLSIDLSQISTRGEVDSILSEKILSGKVRGLILKNLQRTVDNNFAWKIDVSILLNNLEKMMEGIDRRAEVSQQITGFPVIFLKGEDSDYLPSDDFGDIQKVFPAAEFITVPDSGHWIHSDRPDEVIKHLKRLLDDR